MTLDNKQRKYDRRNDYVNDNIDAEMAARDNPILYRARPVLSSYKNILMFIKI